MAVDPDGSGLRFAQRGRAVAVLRGKGAYTTFRVCPDAHRDRPYLSIEGEGVQCTPYFFLLTFVCQYVIMRTCLP